MQSRLYQWEKQAMEGTPQHQWKLRRQKLSSDSRKPWQIVELAR